MRVLFSFVGGTGHAEPLLPIARAAVAAGHEITFTAEAAMVPRLLAIGFVAVPSGCATLRTERMPLLALDPVHEQQVLRDVFAGWLGARRAEDVAALIATLRPAIVITDEADFGAMVAAEAAGVPRVVVSVTASGTFVQPENLAGALNRLRAEHGLAEDGELAMLRGDLLVSPLPRSFRDPASPVPPGAWSIRPAALEQDDVRPVPSWLAQRSGRQVVYATLGTIFDLEAGDLYLRILEGLSSLAVDVVATVGERIDPGELGSWGEHVRIERFIPQGAILKCCDAVVCHGGSGSVIGALAHGRPVVVMPMGTDQPDNAARCTALGVGIVLDVMGATPGDIAAAVTELFTDESYRTAAERIRDEAVALPPAASVVPLLERLVSAN